MTDKRMINPYLIEVEGTPTKGGIAHVMTGDGPRAYFEIFDTAERHTFHMTPESMKIKKSANFHQREVLGMGTQDQDYSYTNNTVFTFDIHITASAKRGAKRGVQQVATAVNFLTKCLHPRARSPKWRGGEPSIILLYWPNMIDTQGQIHGIEWDVRMFDRSGAPTYVIAKVKFVADYGGNVMQEDYGK